MHLRSKRQLPKMGRSNPNATTSTAATASKSMSNVQSTQQTTQAIPTSGVSTSETFGTMILTIVSLSSPAVVSSTVAATQSIANLGSQSSQGFWIFNPINHRNQLYGIPASYMAGLQINSSAFSENLNATLHPLFDPGVNVPVRNAQQSLTNTSLMALRQQMEDSNHDMVNMLTRKIGTMFNPLVQDTNNRYQALYAQMERIANFFGAAPVRNTPAPQNQNPRPVETHVEKLNNVVLVNPVQQPVVEPQAPRVPKRILILVNRNTDAEQIVRQAQQNNLKGRNNIANIFEALLTYNGFNMGLHRPNFVLALSEICVN